MSIFKDQAKFMQACGQSTDEMNMEQARLYAGLIHEEFNELLDSVTEENEVKELMDLIVVLVGYGLSSGWDLEGAWKEVWQSNMSKIDPETGTILKREDGKVLKPASYKPADMSAYV